ncbi:MAG: hypothetical protein ACR2MT_01355, partial [Aurantibacter sp.]
AAYSIFTNVWKDSTQTLDDLTLAGRYLAKMDWLFYKKNGKAHGILDSLEQLGHDLVPAYLLRARIFADESRWEDAIGKAGLANKKAISETEKYHALSGYCHNILEKNKIKLLMATKQSPADSLELQKGYALLRELANDQVGDVAIAKLHLGYSLLLKNGPEAFKAWMSYFRLTDINQVHSTLLSSVDSFKNSLDRYDQGQIDDTDLDAIIKGLAESGFYELAVLVKNQQYGPGPHPDPAVNEIVSYHHFLQKMDAVTKGFYLQTLLGQVDENKYRNALLAEAKILWDQLSWSDNPPSFTKENFKKEIRNRFKAILALIKANGYYGLHMGHVILDDKKRISQYEESAEFRYVAIDHMVSNGYSGWFWDGEAETGGWANDDESFLQVRSAYTAGPIHSWQAVTDSLEIIKTKKSIRDLSVADDSLAASNPATYLPGLSKRINYNEKKELLDSLSGMNLNGSVLRLNFINVLESIVLGSSIYAHEGRHAIDKKNDYNGNSEELEYRAKLSEVYFAKKPLLAFNAILSRNIGDGTSHGNANLRVIHGLVKWIEKNKSKIHDFDPNRPVLPQIDKLNDQQLKNAIKSMDPMAK